MGAARVRAEVNHEAQTVGNVASSAAVLAEPFPSLVAVRALHVIVGCPAQEFGCVPPRVCAEKEGRMNLSLLLMTCLEVQCLYTGENSGHVYLFEAFQVLCTSEILQTTNASSILCSVK